MLAEAASGTSPAHACHSAMATAVTPSLLGSVDVVVRRFVRFTVGEACVSPISKRVEDVVRRVGGERPAGRPPEAVLDDRGWGNHQHFSWFGGAGQRLHVFPPACLRSGLEVRARLGRTPLVAAARRALRAADASVDVDALARGARGHVERVGVGHVDENGLECVGRWCERRLLRARRCG